MRSIEICAGGGGQALGLEQAGFTHVALVEIDKHACSTLRKNRPNWNVIEGDIREFTANNYFHIDLLAGGVPCPPFSIAGKQLGHDDERDLFPEALRLAHECDPKTIMIENVRGILDNKFFNYRKKIMKILSDMGYSYKWELVHTHHYGVPQLRPRALLIAMKEEYFQNFSMPLGVVAPPPTVGQLLYNEMASNGWRDAAIWAEQANGIAPTIVGGSKKHGGADLGPTRARIAWERLGVDGKGIADAPPDMYFTGIPRLTVKMAALIQGFPKNWEFEGRKTAAYRQVGNAFPPPVAKTIAAAIYKALVASDKNVHKYAEEAL